jgi:hypothetical protein
MRFPFIPATALILSLCACRHSPAPVTNTLAQLIPQQAPPASITDYGDPDNWLACPPALSATHGVSPKAVDVFFVYPTSWRNTGGIPLADIGNPEMRQWADYYLKTRASALETVGNIYAPFYRQLDSAYLLSSDPGKIKQPYWAAPFADVIAAFDYYIRRHNAGRPFVLFGHSQGSLALQCLLFTYMRDHPEVYSRMVAAYTIGTVWTAEDYAAHPWLKPARFSSDVGVVIAYNTEASHVDGANPFAAAQAVTINPLSWTQTTAHIPRTRSLGSVIAAPDGTLTAVSQMADARYEPSRGTIICTTVDREAFSSAPASRAYFPIGVLHENDIPLYYFDLRHNAVERTRAFLAAWKRSSQ